MKRIIAIVLTFCAFVCSAQTLPSKWKVTRTSAKNYCESWTGPKHMVPATECGTAYLTVLRKDGGNDAGLRYSIYKEQMPRVEGLTEGNCMMIVIPAGKGKIGPYVEMDLMLGSRPDSPKYFLVEYFDKGEWKVSQAALRTAKEDPSIRYNVKCSGRDNEPANVLQTIRFSKPVKGDVKIRLRVVGNISCSGKPLSGDAPDSGVRMLSYGYIGGYVADFGAWIPKDTLKVGWVGNSFTFVNAADFILKNLAWNEGHYLDFRISVYPGARFRNHLILGNSLDVVTEGGYDYVILQDQSQQAARYGRDSTATIKEHTQTLSSVFRYFSPDCKFIYEQTWAFEKDEYGGFGSFEEFDKCADKGAEALAKLILGEVSPIAQAFAVVRAERPDINLYSTDYHHPADFGAYLKACVNYLVMFKTPFGDNPADFALNPEVTAYLRSVAERVVLK